MLDACGGNLAQASQTSGVPRKTPEWWANGRSRRVAAPEVAEHMDKLCREKRGKLATKLEEIAWPLAESLPSKIDEAPLSQIAISFGIVVDKMRLLREDSPLVDGRLSEKRQWAQRVKYPLGLQRVFPSHMPDFEGV